MASCALMRPQNARGAADGAQDFYGCYLSSTRIGEMGRVTGTVVAQRVIVRGTISGVIRGATVTLQSSSHVECDIHHMSLAIEQGAEFDGRCRRAADAKGLIADLGA
jgi:cytoskeletal protein CcmA (bactofilin family)